jgi:hypothetical protein
MRRQPISEVFNKERIVQKEKMKPILPFEMRKKVMDYLDQGYSRDEIFEKIHKEAEPFLKPNQDLKKCISAIKGHRSQGQKVNK